MFGILFFFNDNVFVDPNVPYIGYPPPPMHYMDVEPLPANLPEPVEIPDPVEVVDGKQLCFSFSRSQL